MKKKILCVLMVLCMACALPGCSRENNLPDYVDIAALPEDYSLEDAKNDGCVVFEDHLLTSGEEEWAEFLRVTKKKWPADIRIAKYYSNPPQLFLTDVSYDGKMFTPTQPGLEPRSYKYLIRYTDADENSSSFTYSSYEYYVLMNEEGVSFSRVIDADSTGPLASQLDQFIVYTNLVE